MSIIKYQQALKKLERMERSERGELTAEDLNIIKLNIIKHKYLHKKSVPFICPVMVYFQSKSVHMKCELDDILNLIKSDAMKLESDYISNVLKGNADKMRLFVEKQKKFTPCGIFYGRRDRIDIRQLNGIILLETYQDRLTSQQIEAINKESYTYSSFRLLEKDRYAILVKTTGMTGRNYKSFQYQLKEYYRKLIGIDTIYATDLNRAVTLSHDKGLYKSDTIKYYSIN